MIRLLVVDDHVIVRDGLCRLLEAQSDMLVVGSANGGPSALDLLINGLKVDLLLTDLNMPVMDGFALTRQALADNPNLKVIILSMVTSNISQLAAAAGAHGSLSKDGDTDELLALIRLIVGANEHAPVQDANKAYL